MSRLRFSDDFTSVDGTPTGERLSRLAIEALLGGPQEGLSGNEKLARFRLASKIADGAEAYLLTDEERVLLRKVGEANLSILGWGRLSQVLDTPVEQEVG